MRILITGGEGLLATGFTRTPSDHTIRALSRAQLDVTDAAAAREVIGHIRPDWVVHAAAMTDTARCEREPGLAFAVNAAGAENVARACAVSEARLIAISTNEVFPGDRREPYPEDAETASLNAYGRSKIEGERRAARACPDACIVRTSWLYGAERGFTLTVQRAVRAGERLRFVTDEVASPTSALDLASAIVALIDRNASGGVYHLTNDGAASRYEWAREILRLEGSSAEVQPVTTAELRASGYNGPLKPPYSVLANNNARALGVTMRPWQGALADWCKDS